MWLGDKGVAHVVYDVLLDVGVSQATAAHDASCTRVTVSAARVMRREQPLGLVMMTQESVMPSSRLERPTIVKCLTTLVLLLSN